MSRFPNGRPKHLLGSLDSPPPTASAASIALQQSNADDDFDWGPNSSHADEDSASDEDEERLCKKGSKKRVRDPSRIPVGDRKRTKVPWIGYDIVQGWSVVMSLFTIFSQQCDCTPLVSRNGHASSYCITYRFDTATGLAASGSAK
jgi:hypothetical protein